jgi:hypothetical protein
LHCSVFTAEIGQFIGEVLARKRPKGSRFPDTLRSFEDQTTIRLGTWTMNPGDSRNHPP